MPETDWLTGLSSRAAFARQVRQADRDRDRFAVAIVGIHRMEEINRRFGFDVGDDLLRLVGRALAGLIGVGTTIARLGGAQFGIMTVGEAAEDMTGWCDPLVSAINAALAEWTFEQIDFGGDCLVQPGLIVGAAGGYSGEIWGSAGLALSLADADANAHPGPARLIIYDRDDPRLVKLLLQQERDALIDRNLDDGSMAFLVQEVNVVGRPNQDRRWLRLVAQAPPWRDDSHVTPSPVMCSELSPAVGRRLERWLVEQAVTLVSTHGGQLRVTIPVTWELDTGAGFFDRLLPLLQDLMVPASRLVFEVDETDLLTAGAAGNAFVAGAKEMGSCVALAGCDGGHRTALAMTAAGIRYVKPTTALAEAAERGGRGAERVLDALALTAADAGQELISPVSALDDRYLAAVGVTFVERPPVTR